MYATKGLIKREIYSRSQKNSTMRPIVETNSPQRKPGSDLKTKQSQIRKGLKGMQSQTKRI